MDWLVSQLDLIAYGFASIFMLLGIFKCVELSKNVKHYNGETQKVFIYFFIAIGLAIAGYFLEQNNKDKKIVKEQQWITDTKEIR